MWSPHVGNRLIWHEVLGVGVISVRIAGSWELCTHKGVRIECFITNANEGLALFTRRVLIR